MAQVKFKINYTPHAGQLEVLKGLIGSNADIATIVASRGYGKTIFVTNSIVLPLMLSIPNAQIMWIAPRYRTARIPVEDVWMGLNENTGERYIPQFDEATGFKFWEFKKADMELHLWNGSKLYLRTADSPDSIVGKGFNHIVMDEASLIPREVLMTHILPTARRKGCKITAIGTPRGKNWFYDFYRYGQDPTMPDYVSFLQPYWKRPDYPVQLLRLMRQMPEHLRKQEFEAQFIDGSSGVFKNLDKVFTGPPIEFDSEFQEWSIDPSSAELEGDTFVLGVDFAKHSDYTVFIVMGINSKKIFYYSRFNKTDYKVVLERILKVSERYDADVIFDATGVGSGLSDFLSSKLNCYPYVFTNESKNELINKLIIAVEFGEIQIPHVATIRKEFEAFTFELTKTGKISYGAPDNQNDDTIIGIALALWYAEEHTGKGQIEELDSFLSTIESIRRPRSKLDHLMEEDD